MKITLDIEYRDSDYDDACSSIEISQNLWTPNESIQFELPRIASKFTLNLKDLKKVLTLFNPEHKVDLN